MNFSYSMRPVFAGMLFSALCYSNAMAATPVAGAEIKNAPQAETQNAALRELVAKVLQTHPRIRAAQAAADAAGAQRDAATKPRFNPELQIAGQRTDVTVQTVGINQTLDWHDKGQARALAAEHEHMAAQQQLRNVEQQLTTEVLLAVTRYHTARQLAHLRADQVALLERVAALANQRFTAGDIGQSEVDLAQLGATQSAAEANAAQLALADALAALQIATQLSLETWPSLPREMAVDQLPSDNAVPGAGKPEDRDAWFAVAEQLPHVASLRASWEAAKAKASLAEKERRPDPTVGVVLGRDGEENLLGVSLSIPLYVRNNFTDEAHAAQQEVLVAESLLNDAREQARLTALQTLSRFRLTLIGWQRWRDLEHRSVNEQLKTLERLWRAGDMSTSDYLLQSGQYVDAQGLGVSMQGRVWEAWIEWMAASGRLREWMQFK